LLAIPRSPFAAVFAWGLAEESLFMREQTKSGSQKAA